MIKRALHFLLALALLAAVGTLSVYALLYTPIGSKNRLWVPAFWPASTRVAPAPSAPRPTAVITRLPRLATP